MSNAFMNALADQWPALAFTVLSLLTLYCGGPWGLLVRLLATMAAFFMALSSFCLLMDHATRKLLLKAWEGVREFAWMSAEALMQAWKEARENRRAALEEMGERA